MKNSILFSYILQEANLRNINFRLITFFSLFLFVSFAPLTSYAAQTIYTIQTGSFDAVEPAQNQFDSIAQALNEKQLDYLRIEKIGNFYSVRLGKFENNAAAERFLEEVKPYLPTAIVRDAYFIEDRIVKIYKPSLERKPKVEEKPLPSAVPDKIKPPLAEKPVEAKIAEPLEKQIKIISELVDKKDYEKALEVIKTEIEARPENPEINGWYGAVLLKMKHPSDALTYLQKAAELSPQVSDYHNGVGYCLFYLNKFNEAINEFTKAVTLDPAHIDALTGLGVAYIKIGKKDKALDIYNKLLNLDLDTANKLLKIIEGKKS